MIAITNHRSELCRVTSGSMAAQVLEAMIDRFIVHARCAAYAACLLPNRYVFRLI